MIYHCQKSIELKMKNIIIFNYCLIFIIICGCSSSIKKDYQPKKIPFEDQYAKVNIEKIADLSFDTINANYGWKNYMADTRRDSINNVLRSDYKTPFSPTTTFMWVVIEKDSFDISLLDIKGNKICSLYNGNLLQGYYEISFKELNINSGIYLVEMRKGKEKYFKKIALIK
jgi:hypothetical protein